MREYIPFVAMEQLLLTAIMANYKGLDCIMGEIKLTQIALHTIIEIFLTSHLQDHIYIALQPFSLHFGYHQYKTQYSITYGILCFILVLWIFSASRTLAQSKILVLTPGSKGQDRRPSQPFGPPAVLYKQSVVRPSCLG